MKNTFRLLLIAFVAIIATPRLARAQGLVTEEYFRQLGMPDQLATVTPPTPETEERYNFAVGPFRFNIAAGVGLEYNDNITLAEHSKQSDFILRPSLTLDGYWTLSEVNTLRFSLGISYAKYFNHSQFDTRGILVSPSSALALSVHAGNFIITIRDQFTYQEDPIQNPTLSNVSNYQRFENTAGIQVNWPASETVTVIAGYDHYNMWAFQNQYDQLTRTTESVYIRPSVAVSPSVTVGLDVSASFVKFDKAIQNDGNSYLVGPFAQITLTEATQAYIEAGYQLFEFDQTGSINDNSNSSSWYGRLQITNKLSEAITQRLSASKSAEVGYGTNFYDLYHVEYGAVWQMTPSMTLDPTVFWEHYQTSSDTTTTAESASRFGFALGLRYALTPTLTLGADYRFVLKDSNVPNSNYRQNVALLSLYYNF